MWRRFRSASPSRTVRRHKTCKTKKPERSGQGAPASRRLRPRAGAAHLHCSAYTQPKRFNSRAGIRRDSVSPSRGRKSGGRPRRAIQARSLRERRYICLMHISASTHAPVVRRGFVFVPRTKSYERGRSYGKSSVRAVVSAKRGEPLRFTGAAAGREAGTLLSRPRPRLILCQI